MRKLKKFKAKPKTKYTSAELRELFTMVNGAIEIYILTSNLTLEQKLVCNTLELFRIRIIKILATPATEYRFTFRHNEKIAFCIATMNSFIIPRGDWSANFLRLIFTPLHQTL